MLIKVYKKFKEIYETYVKIFKVKNWKENIRWLQ